MSHPTNSGPGEGRRRGVSRSKPFLDKGVEVTLLPNATDTFMTEDAPHSVRDDIAAFDIERPRLEAVFLGKWVIFHDCKFAGVFDDFPAAAADAMERFGTGPYLIRRVGERHVTLPTSVMYGPLHVVNTLRP